MFNKRKTKVPEDQENEETNKNHKKKRKSFTVKINRIASRINKTSLKKKLDTNSLTITPSLAANTIKPSLAAITLSTANSTLSVGKPQFESTMINYTQSPTTNQGMSLALEQSRIISRKKVKTNRRNERRDIKRLLDLSENIIDINNTRRCGNATWDELRSENTKY